MSGATSTVREAVINGVIRHANFFAVSRFRSPDSIPEQSTKLKIAASHGGLDLWNRARINHIGTGSAAGVGPSEGAGLGATVVVPW